ncbi:MAG: ATP-dependent Clp protease ATP-binding subunit [Planctomycetota bacterium]|nr:MAG: ATP-dependent Clp protease ATP-binding subunit [Planctomycetota bacterium]REK25809.1 MAG: ATP-dependent Clp protease ATP-binding subunit [Planctomycetota bacterium]REK49480.1 MAG: ATP-dependent Clp protease ATP-binding subunit [Planctomycetota bacterium]
MPEAHRHESIIDPKIAFSESLTKKVRQSGDVREFPLEGEQHFETFFNQFARALFGSPPNHVLLVADRGVGPQAMIAEAARRAARGEVPFLTNTEFISVDCRYTPEESSRDRLLAVINQLFGHEQLVAVIDGFADLMRTAHGASNRSLLLFLLAQLQCQLVGTVTSSEYQEVFAGDPDIHEFFVPIKIEEPDEELTRRLLRHYKCGLESKYEVAIETEAVAQAVVLSANYILNDQLPAKALRVLQQICEDIDFERSQRAHPKNEVRGDDVVRAVSAITGVPAETLRGVAEKCDYESSLSQLVVAQPHAIHEVATELSLIKAGLIDPGQPASVMLFMGQTGTGKTEMAKALARFYSTSKQLRTYTLGNFVEPHSVAGIIGVPPGYVGHDQGGRIVNELHADPYGIFLLDEADKAHPDVMQPFLNLFDEGWIVDQRGRKAYADRAIFILTTNVGQRQIAEMSKKGESIEAITSKMKETLAKIKHTKLNRPVFPPEFLARIKRTIVFLPLDSGAMQGIGQKLIREMQARWSRKRGKQLVVPQELIDYIAAKSHDENSKADGREGGRIVRKLIADIVESPLQRAISDRPQDYRNCGRVALACTIHNDAGDEHTNGDGIDESKSADVSVTFLE